MNNALLGLAGLLIAVLAALFAVPYFIDWNGYRGLFEEEASRVLGRDVRVGGGVNVRLLPVPYVNFDKVRVADTANDTGDPFFRVDSFTMWLSISPLLRGQLEARRVELTKPVLRLVVDPQGSGNWSTVTARSGALPFVASGVALQSVRIREGAVQVVRGQGGVNRGTLADLTGIDGEFEAETLEGPFRFKGTLLWQNEARDVRLASTKLDADGSLRLKASVRVPANGNAYALDGHLADIRQRPRLDGEITARMALQPVGAAKGASASLDGKGRLEADGTGLRLREIQASLENAGQPQLVSGEAQMAWVARPEIEARLASRLLDLDRLSGSATGAPAIEVARGLVATVIAALPAEADATVALDVDQATLGGDSVNAVSVVLQRAGDRLDLKQMRAGLPGGGRLELAGRIEHVAAASKAATENAGAAPADKADAKATAKPAEKAAEKAAGDGGGASQATGDGALALDGNMVLRGTSLNRFLAWAAPKSGPAGQRGDGPFLLAGRLLASDKVLQISEATAELGKTQLTGSARLDMGERRRVGVRLDGRQINLGQLWPEAFGGGAGTGALEALLPGLAARLGLPPAAGAERASPAGKEKAVDLAHTDIDARIQAAEVVVGDDVLGDVDADVSVERGKLVIRGFRATTADKLGLDVAGVIDNAGHDGKGVLRWTADAATPAAVAALARLAGGDGDTAARTARYGALAPVRLAGTLALSQRGARTTDLALDGVLSGGRVVARLLSDAEPAGWRTAHLDASAKVDGGDTIGLLRLAVPGMVAASGADVVRRGQLFVKAVGVADKGMATLAALDGEGLKLGYDGRWQVAADGRHALDGTWQAKSSDSRTLMALAGLPLAGGMAAISADGEGTVVARSGDVALTSPRLMLGASTIAGRLNIKRPADKPVQLDADLTADRATVAGLFAGLSGAPAPAAPASGGPASGGAASGPSPSSATAAPATTPWPQEAFDTRVLDGFDGRVVGRFGRLVLEPGLALADAQFEARLTPGRIDIARLDGVALGGKLAMTGTLEKAAAGVKLTGHLGTDGVNLVALGSPEREAAASGPLAVTLDVSGQGGSAAAIVASLSGNGQVVAGPAEIAGFTPGALASLAEAAIAGKGERAGEGLAKAVTEAVAQGRFKIPATTVPVEVRDGVLKSKPLVIESSGGRTTLDVAAELPSLKIDADWQVEAVMPKPADGRPEKGPLPAVSIAYVGRWKDIGSIPPRIGLTPFERELEVRKMERDVEELERLRKLDEERARAEQERLKALEAEKQRAAEAEKAAAAQAAAAAAAAGTVGSGAVPPRGADAPAAQASPGAAPSPAQPAPAQKPSAADNKPGDWKTVETPAEPAPADNAAKPERPAAPAAPKPQPASRPKPKAWSPESLFKPN